MEEVKKAFSEDELELLVVYVREPHPRQGVFKNYPQPRTMEKKFAYAREMVSTLGVTATVLVDTIDGKVHRLYGVLPNPAYLIDQDGKIAAKWSWTNPRQIKAKALELLGRQ